MPIFAIAAAVLVLILPAAAEPQTRTFYNEKGQQTGRATTRGNTTTWDLQRPGCLQRPPRNH
jgi:hypothetical protein